MKRNAMLHIPSLAANMTMRLSFSSPSSSLPPSPLHRRQQRALVFVADDKFADVVTELQRRGWRRFPHLSFPKFDLKWTNYRKLQWSRVAPQQIVNHVQCAVLLSCKDELAARLYAWQAHREREQQLLSGGANAGDTCTRVIWHARRMESVDAFFPRTFDMARPHREALSMWFMYSRAVALVKQAVGVEHELAWDVSKGVGVEVALSFLSKVLALPGGGGERFFSCCTHDLDEVHAVALALEIESARWRVLSGRDGPGNQGARTMASSLQQAHQTEGQRVLTELSRCDPQFHAISGGCGNVWICKPSQLSQGRGIQLSSSLDTLLALAPRDARADVNDNTVKKTDTKASAAWVVQKYMEQPLLLQGGRKFDIRQWVLITSLAPLRVFWYDRCYLRFCSTPFSLSQEHLGDSFMHLSNHSIQKHAASLRRNMNLECEDQVSTSTRDDRFESMWHSQRFQDTLRLEHGRDVWSEDIVPQMQRAALAAIQSVQSELKMIGRGFEWLGIDFLVDAEYRVWLLEVNVTPDVSLSTRVTAELVPQATRDTLDLILSDDPSIVRNGWLPLRS